MDAKPSIPACVAERVRGALGVAPEALRVTPIKQGKWCNANLYRVEGAGRILVVKEFHSRHPLVRATVGRLLIGREAKALCRLAGLPGVPGGAQRLGPAALCVEYVAGSTLSERYRQGNRVPTSFFEELERRLECMHQKGFAHLDMRNLGNMICGDDGQPWFIDFQACVCTRCLPPLLRRQMEDTDQSGIYKAWIKLGAEPLDATRAAWLEQFGRTRKLWVFKGYWFSKAVNHLRRKKPPAEAKTHFSGT